MISIVDGPAGGQTFMARRAPTFLRIVRDQAGRWDTLDALDDEPRDGEEVFVYRITEGTWGPLFICRPTRGAGGRFESGSYVHLPDAPADRLRETDEWRLWVVSQA